MSDKPEKIFLDETGQAISIHREEHAENNAGLFFLDIPGWLTPAECCALARYLTLRFGKEVAAVDVAAVYRRRTPEGSKP